MMTHIGMDHEHSNAHDNGYGANDGWVDISQSYSSSQQQSPVYEHGGFGFMQSMHGLPIEPSFNPQRVQQSASHAAHQQLLPLIMPSHPTWPSMLTHPGSYSAPQVAIPAVAAPLAKGSHKKIPGVHTSTTPRKTLTDSDRRRMCQYHEDNPTVKQTEIGGELKVDVIW